MMSSSLHAGPRVAMILVRRMVRIYHVRTRYGRTLAIEVGRRPARCNAAVGFNQLRVSLRGDLQRITEPEGGQDPVDRSLQSPPAASCLEEIVERIPFLDPLLC